MAKADLEFRKDNTYYDQTGTQIIAGDLLRVFHFRTRGKIYYMYHVAVIEETKDFPVMSGASYDTTNKPHYRFYVISSENRIFEDAKIVFKNDLKAERKKVKIPKNVLQHIR